MIYFSKNPSHNCFDKELEKSFVWLYCKQTETLLNMSFICSYRSKRIKEIKDSRFNYIFFMLPAYIDFF